MDLISIQVSPREYFQLRKLKISEEMKCLKDFAERYNSKPEMVGLMDEIMNYLQSLRQDVQDIESLVKRGEPPASSNLNGTDLHRRQEITQQNFYFKPTLNRESEVAINPSVESSSGTKKRKLKSKVWKDFEKYVGKDGKERVRCIHCDKDFVGSSKSGTTHLKNHLKSCPRLRNSGLAVDKEKEKSVIDPNSNDSNLIQKIIKYGLNGIKNDILNVYEQEKHKFREYLDQLHFYFHLTIEWPKLSFEFWVIRIWFFDDSWKLRSKFIFAKDYVDEDDVSETIKSVLVDWNMHKNICSVIFDIGILKDTENMSNWLKEQSSFPIMGTHDLDFFSLLWAFQDSFPESLLTKPSHRKILDEAKRLREYVNTSLNVQKCNRVVQTALSMGKIVTFQSVPDSSDTDVNLLKWVMGCKEAFCELEHIDPDFKFINFIKEDWDDAILLFSCEQVFEDWKKQFVDLLEDSDESANMHVHTIGDTFLKLVQLGKSDNYYIGQVASEWAKSLSEFGKSHRLFFEMRIILDPRCKMGILEHYYKMIYENDAMTYFQRAIDDVTNIYKEYIKSMSSSSSSQNYNISFESEFDYYLRDKYHQEDEGFDILQWWCDKSSIYPTLVKMARDFLSMPLKFLRTGSSLPKEIYVTCDQLDDDFKSKLACTKIWLSLYN